MGFNKETEEVVKKLNLEKTIEYPDKQATKLLAIEEGRDVSKLKYPEDWVVRYIDIFEYIQHDANRALANAHECKCAWAIRIYGIMASYADSLQEKIKEGIKSGSVGMEEGGKAIRDIDQRINNDFPIELQNEMNHNCRCDCKIPYNTFMGRWKD